MATVMLERVATYTIVWCRVTALDASPLLTRHCIPCDVHFRTPARGLRLSENGSGS